MKNIKSHFMFKKQQRSVIFLLLVIILVLQLVYFFMPVKSFEVSIEEHNQIVLFQKEIDSLKKLKKAKQHNVLPYNPNYITDYKGYVLGMSISEIDRITRVS